MITLTLKHAALSINSELQNYVFTGTLLGTDDGKPIALLKALDILGKVSTGEQNARLEYDYSKDEIKVTPIAINEKSYTVHKFFDLEAMSTDALKIKIESRLAYYGTLRDTLYKLAIAFTFKMVDDSVLSIKRMFDEFTTDELVALEMFLQEFACVDIYAELLVIKDKSIEMSKTKKLALTRAYEAINRTLKMQNIIFEHKRIINNITKAMEVLGNE